MIRTVAGNGLWIAGLSMLLAAAADAHAEAVRRGARLPVVLRERGYAAACRLAIGISCVGWGAAQADWFAVRAGWILLGLWFVWAARAGSTLGMSISDSQKKP
jgi:hypothetical protein